MAVLHHVLVEEGRKIIYLDGVVVVDEEVIDDGVVGQVLQLAEVGLAETGLLGAERALPLQHVRAHGGGVRLALLEGLRLLLGLDMRRGHVLQRCGLDY